MRSEELVMMTDTLRVALLSFHSAYNYGAAMQAFGLQESLREMGVEAFYIDYLNERRRHMYAVLPQAWHALGKGNVGRAARLIAGCGFVHVRANKFKNFYRTHLRTTARTYGTSEEARELDGLYDKYIVGSDQVWNSDHNGADPAFLLDFVENTDDKIAYASSFGMSDIPEEYATMYSRALSRIGRIAVREVAAARIVKKHTGREPHVVLDPVFLADLDVWERLRQEGSAKDEDYVFFYTNRKGQVRDFWNLGYEKRGLKSHILSSYVSLGDFVDPDTSVRVAMSPADFLNEIASAQLVVTASFHCVAFSILFHKDFVVFLTGNRGRDERILNLLHICGLTSRIVTGKTCAEDVEAHIDYDAVEEKLVPYRDYSREYLRRAVFSEPDVDVLRYPTGDGEYFCEDERCTGCMACAAACPVGAIACASDDEGFVVPVRNASKCIDCHLCHGACQVFQPPVRERIVTQRYVAVKNTDAIRRHSSSGGIFSALSDVVLSRGGIICAAVMGADFKVRHAFATSAEERDLMRKTLYIQSDVSEVYGPLGDYLSKHVPVLFVGTPCQVAGLYRALSDSDTRDLYTCDIVCHGVPSPGVFAGFVDHLRALGGVVEEFNFRDKALGWKHGYTVSAICGGKRQVNTLEIQSFVKMFSQSIINRRCCASCMYATFERVGDISIGDCWGYGESLPGFSDRLGVSLVIVNTKKGADLFAGCKAISTVELTKEQARQNSLMRQAEPSGNRMDAFRVFREHGYGELAKRYGECNPRGFARNLARRVLGRQ